MAKDVDGGADAGAADNPVELDLLKRESAGKDKKISLLLSELETVRRRLGELEAAEPEHDELAALQRKVGELQAIEAAQKQQADALAFATAHRVPFTLAVSNATRLEELQAELAEIGQMRKPITGRPGLGGSLTVSQVRKMSAGEVARIPQTVLDRLLEESE